ILKIFFLAHFDELLLKFLVALSFARLNKQITNLRGFPTRNAGPTMSVRAWHFFTGPARHEENLDYSFLLQPYSSSRNTLLIKLVMSEKFLATKSPCRRIIED